MGNPLLQSSPARRFAARVILVSAVFLFLFSLYGPVSGDLAVLLFFFAPIIAGLLGFIAWYYHTYHVD